MAGAYHPPPVWLVVSDLDILYCVGGIIQSEYHTTIHNVRFPRQQLVTTRRHWLGSGGWCPWCVHIAFPGFGHTASRLS